jgi:glutamate N-acetyltransferase/amino-acid N-acetyltransferase
MEARLSQQLPRGFRFAGVAAGIKKTGAADFAAIISETPCSTAATFTRNAFPAAPVLYDRDLVKSNPAGVRGVVINSGCANACTGDEGLADAALMARLAEDALRQPPRTLAVMSTGVIGPRLPMDRVRAGAELAAAALSPEAADEASRAIMTTDTRPKVALREAGPARLWGMCKGAGMIHPNMATMLAVIVTDAAIAPAALDAALRAAVDSSFNCISVDGDMSTNDTVLALANGAAGPVDGAVFAAALTALCQDLAQQIVRDGEGATKFITIGVSGAASASDARVAAKAIANSPLVKTAFYGGDANWGRILAAVGYSGAAVDPGKAQLWIAAGTGDASSSADRLQLVAQGRPLVYSEERATAIFAGSEIAVSVALGSGEGSATVWTCDLSHAYVDINGHYRT